MTPPPRLAPVVRLERRRHAHAELLYEWLRDPALYQHLDPAHRPVDLAALIARIARSEGERSPDGQEVWLNWVVLDEADALVGCVQTTIYPDGDSNVAYTLGREHWGRGLAQAAVQAMLDEVVRLHPVNTFSIVTESTNTRSVALAQRLGFLPGSAAAAQRHQLSASELIFQRPAH